jgi:DNA-binding FadR family transcriptional regulator
MILLIGSLELIWSAHESSVWDGHGEPMVDKTRRAALRDHQRLLDAICDGNAARAVRLAQDHLAAARRNTLAVGADQTIEARLISDLGPRLGPRSAYNGRPQSRKGSGR